MVGGSGNLFKRALWVTNPSLCLKIRMIIMIQNTTLKWTFYMQRRV